MPYTSAQKNLPPQWVFVTTNILATSSVIYIYLGSAGDIYIDDVSLVGSAGTNLVADGGFESPLGGSWNLTANFAQLTISSTVSHSGTQVFTWWPRPPAAAAAMPSTRIFSSTLTLNAPCTLSFWYLQSTNGSPLVLRLSSGTSYAASVNPAPPTLPALALSTPGATNSVLAALSPFPSLWINELQADNLTGITNSAGQHAGWTRAVQPHRHRRFPRRPLPGQ